MKILMKKMVRNVGSAGAIVEVSDAYARNYLIPNGLAVVASADVVAKAHAASAAQRTTETKMQRDLQVAQAKLLNVTVRLAGQGQPGKHLYQALKIPDIITAIEQQFDVRLPNVQTAPVSIKATGSHQVKLRWPNTETTTITVVVEIAESKTTPR